MVCENLAEAYLTNINQELRCIKSKAASSALNMEISEENNHAENCKLDIGLTYLYKTYYKHGDNIIKLYIILAKIRLTTSGAVFDMLCKKHAQVASGVAKRMKNW